MTNRLFSKSTLAFSVAGLALNIALVWATDILHIPLYLDSIGTVTVAALCGMLPGIAVGFLTNCVTSLLSISPDAMTLYYGILNVLIAVAAAWLSKRGLLRKWYGMALALAAFAFIGGALGSVVTWTLYGFSFGGGVSAPLAVALYEWLGLSEFTAQLTADMVIDIADKLITVLCLAAALRLLPERLAAALPLGPLYLGEGESSPQADAGPLAAMWLRGEPSYRRISIRTKMTLLIVTATTILGVIALIISAGIYRSRLIEQYSEMCGDVVDLMLSKIEPAGVEDYLALGEDAPGYGDLEGELYDILNSADRIKYMYVYRIDEDGCHVVFDLDSEGLAGEPPGTVVPFDDSFPYVSETIAGEEIPYVITDDTYGWLLTVYKPVRGEGLTLPTYAAADIDMREIRTNLYSFCISIASLLFGVLIVLTAFTLWYCDRRLLDPLGVLVLQARELDFEGVRKGRRVRDTMSVGTGDEIEEVFRAMCLTEDAIAKHVSQLNEKNLEISHMQRNIIYTLANMVENRSANTGGHIKRTAEYVRLIGQGLLGSGLYPDEVDAACVDLLYDSAPLHDIGKVKIPDAILNKPGRLTTEEFELMKTHTTEGGAILRNALSDIEDDTWLSMAIDMAMYHHERWDGTGYPEGLSGSDIPLCARIMAVSDVFDALISVRSYKAAYPFSQALSMIREGAGTQFDPLVVEVFTRSESDIHEIVNRL